VTVRRILSIAAAPGWSARIDDPEFGVSPVVLVVWALVEDGEATTIVGVVQSRPTPENPFGLEFADEMPGFAGYIFTGLTTKPAQA
jgi:hypothetical protein